MFNKIQKNVENALEFPPDVLGNEPKITVNGRRSIFVENFLEITVFSETEIRLQTTEGEVILTGQQFVLKTILPTELEIEGHLASLVFTEGGRP